MSKLSRIFISNTKTEKLFYMLSAGAGGAGAGGGVGVAAAGGWGCGAGVSRVGSCKV